MDVHTMVYWVLGIIVVLIFIDYFWYRPLQKRQQTDMLINQLRKNNQQFYKTLPQYRGRGIVIPLSDRHITPGLLLVASLRSLGCKLPILITFAGDELSDQHQHYLENIVGVKTIDLAKRLAMDPTNLRGYQMRPYSVIYSPFREVLLLDADTIFLHNPEYLFDEPLYNQTGALFWKSQRYNTFWDKGIFDWVRRLIPYRKGDNKILDKTSGKHQDSGVILINKERQLKTLEKLWVLSKNCAAVYNYLSGEQETYWIAAELAKNGYSFIPQLPGVIGELKMGSVCGHLLHFDTRGSPLWRSKSIFQGDDCRIITDFGYYAFDNEDASWKGAYCLANSTPTELPAAYKHLFNEYAKLAADIKSKLESN